MASIFDTTIDALAGRPPKIDGISGDLAALISQFEELTPEDKRAVLTVVAALRGKSRQFSGTDAPGNLPQVERMSYPQPPLLLLLFLYFFIYIISSDMD